MAIPVGPGETVKISGQYVQMARNGRIMLDGREATLVAGEPGPPTEREGWRWKMVDATRHEDGAELKPGPSNGDGSREPGRAPAGPYRGREAPPATNDDE